MKSRTSVNSVSLGRIKTEFVSQVLSESAKEIRDAQMSVAREWGLFDSGNGDLETSLKGNFSVQPQEGGSRLSMSYLKKARFLDIPDSRRTVKALKKEGYHLYNRICFGIAYGQTLYEIRDGLTEDIKQQLETAIKKSMRQSMAEVNN